METRKKMKKNLEELKAEYEVAKEQLTMIKAEITHLNDVLVTDYYYSKRTGHNILTESFAIKIKNDLELYEAMEEDVARNVECLRKRIYYHNNK